MKATSENAIRAWERLAFYGPTDGPVNDLLENICRERGTAYDGGDIWQSICNLSNSGRRQFLKGCEEMENSLSTEQRERLEEIANEYA